MSPRLRTCLALALIAALAPPPASAAEPSFDCARAETAAERAVCASEDLAALDRELARLYRLARDEPGLSENLWRQLRAHERGWIAERDACEDEATALAPCVAQSYVTRIDEIRSQYEGARAEEPHRQSIGPVLYRCEGLNAPLSAVFVNAGAPARASLRWADQWLVLRQTRSASGARYATGGEDGYVFWIKGEAARLSRPDGPEVRCRVIAAE